MVIKNDLAIGKIKPSQKEKPVSLVQEQNSVKETATHLVLTDGPGLGTIRKLENYPITLGRAEDSTIVIDDDYASGRHARFFPQGNRWLVEDLGSTNGTLLGGKPLTMPTPVEIGVPVKIGQTTIELRK